MTAKEEFKVGILTVSDTASTDRSKDQTGPALVELLTLKGSFNVIEKECVPDEPNQIQMLVRSWCDVSKLDLVITAGGTGFGVRDVTPEAIFPLLEKMAPGLTHAMFAASLQKTPLAALSRPVNGIRGNTIVLTLPGSPKGAKENLEAVLDILPHAIELAKGGTGENVHQGLRSSQQLETSIDTDIKGHHCVHHQHHDHHPHDIQNSDFLSNPLSSPVSRRQRNSPYPMITTDEALNIITGYSKILEPIRVSVDENLIGYVLAQNVIAEKNVPQHPASILDGYAVVASDGPGVYPVVTVCHANASESNDTLQSGQIARITTGGPIPHGATAVVMVEDTTLVRTTADGIEEDLVEIRVESQAHDNIRKVGSDIRAGDVVAHAGDLVSAIGGEIGVFASVGVKSVSVYRQPVVGILSSGNEIVDFNATSELKYGQSYDSNRPTLLAIVKAMGFKAMDFGIAKDNPKELEKTLRSALSQVDVLVTTGGVSMGELDLFKPILERSLGAKIHFGRLNMKPGKPTTFATLSQSNPDPQSGGESTRLVFALPGNPVSAAVTFYVFVLPALRKLAGYKNWKLPILKAELSTSLKLDPRPEYHRAMISFDCSTSKFIAVSTGNQISSRMLSMRNCNALLKLPKKTDDLIELEKGTMVDAILIGQLS